MTDSEGRHIGAEDMAHIHNYLRSAFHHISNGLEMAWTQASIHSIEDQLVNGKADLDVVAEALGLPEGWEEWPSRNTPSSAHP